jgi:hypothetical protein
MVRTQIDLEEIIGNMQCPKDFVCYRSEFEQLCEIKYAGTEAFLECLQESPGDCKFSAAFGTKSYCQCPLRIYIAKRLTR